MIKVLGNNIVNAFTGGNPVNAIYSYGQLVWERPAQANNVIYYTSTDGQIVTPLVGNEDDEYGFGANIVSNTYSGGKGVIVFDRNVTKIGRESFKNKTNLLSIDIPNSVTEIGPYILSYCYGLSSIVLSSNITFLDMGVCLSCRNLVSVTIPDSVVRIAPEVFYICLSLSEVIVNSVVPPVFDINKHSNTYDQFKNNAQGRKIKVPAKSLQAYKTAPGWSDYADDIIAQ